MIKEAYVSLEVAKLLKEKGFDIPVNYEYHYIIDIAQFHKKKHNFNGIEYRNCSSEWYSAPTHQMAMAWLREVYKLYIDVYIVKNYSNKTVKYCITIEDLSFPSSDDGFDIMASHESYEEACEAAIKYCLEKMI